MTVALGVRFQRALRSESDERFRNMVGGFKPLARGVWGHGPSFPCAACGSGSAQNFVVTREGNSCIVCATSISFLLGHMRPCWPARVVENG